MSSSTSSPAGRESGTPRSSKRPEDGIRVVPDTGDAPARRTFADMKTILALLIVSTAVALGACAKKETRTMDYQRTTTGHSK